MPKTLPQHADAAARFVTSKDGTRIAYDRVGRGPALVFVGGALSLRRSSFVQPWVKALAAHFTVYNYDRRGRAESGDTQPYAVQREVEDLAALAEEAGGSPNVFGISSGAALALEAAAAGVPMAKLALYEPPYMIGNPKGAPDADYEQRMNRLIAAGKRDEAVKYFMRTVGVPAWMVGVMRLFPFWKQMRAAAHTLPYDAAVMGRFRLPTERFARIRVPTLALAGEKSPPVLRTASEAVAATVPGTTFRVLAKQNHGVKAAALAPALEAFFLHGNGHPAKPGARAARETH